MFNRIIQTYLDDGINKYGRDYAIEKCGREFHSLLETRSKQEKLFIVNFLEENFHRLKDVATHNEYASCGDILSVMANCGGGITSEFALCGYINRQDMLHIKQVMTSANTKEPPDVMEKKNLKETFFKFVQDVGVERFLEIAKAYVMGLIDENTTIPEEKRLALVKMDIEYFSKLFYLHPEMTDTMIQNWRHTMMNIVTSRWEGPLEREVTEEELMNYELLNEHYITKGSFNEFVNYLYKFIKKDLSLEMQKEIIFFIENAGILLFVPLILYNDVDRFSIDGMRDYMLDSLAKDLKIGGLDYGVYA